MGVMAVDDSELTKDDMDFDEDDLAEMFKGLKDGNGDETDW